MDVTVVPLLGQNAIITDDAELFPQGVLRQLSGHTKSCLTGTLVRMGKMVDFFVWIYIAWLTAPLHQH